MTKISLDFPQLANALRVNKTLELLSIEKNDVHPDGIKALAEALIDNTTLTELRLRDQVSFLPLFFVFPINGRSNMPSTFSRVEEALWN